MRTRIRIRLIAGTLFFLSGTSLAQGPAAMGGEEFGLTQRELVQAVAKVEGLISQCMRKEGFSYLAADYNTVRRGMSADKSLPGMSEEDAYRRSIPGSRRSLPRNKEVQESLCN